MGATDGERGIPDPPSSGGQREPNQLVHGEALPTRESRLDPVACRRGGKRCGERREQGLPDRAMAIGSRIRSRRDSCAVAPGGRLMHAGWGLGIRRGAALTAVASVVVIAGWLVAGTAPAFAATEGSSSNRNAPEVTIAAAVVPSNQFTVSHVQTHRLDGSVTLWVSVPGRGTVDVLETAWNDDVATPASGLQTADGRFAFARLHAAASGATTLHLRVRPNQRGRLLLRAHRYRVTIRLWTTFTPTGGKARSVGVYGLKLTPPRRSLQAQPPYVMRALGDSVTAGFGFFSDGTQMSPLQLPFCIPLDTQMNDRCSSNSPNGPGQTGPVRWSPDYGLGNDVSWAAQAAQTFGLSGTNEFQDLAVSGSAPADWAPGGYLNPTLRQIIQDDPNLTVMTLGANPLLSIFLTGSGAWCAFTLTDAQLRACVQKYIAAQRVGQLVTEVVRQLLTAPNDHIVVSLYHVAIPSLTLFSARDIQIMFGEFNAAINSAMITLPSYGSRVFVISPPPFFIGRAPGAYVCPNNRAAVDGPSHQSTVSQAFLELNPFFSFCPGAPWIISADTGIHPNRTGYREFASALVNLVRGKSWAPPAVDHTHAASASH